MENYSWHFTFSFIQRLIENFNKNNGHRWSQSRVREKKSINNKRIISFKSIL